MTTKVYNGPSLSEYPVKTFKDSNGDLIQYVISGVEGTALYAPISAASSGANEIVAAVTNKKIRVLRYSFSAAGTVNAKWQSASTDLTGLYTEVTATGIAENYCPVGIFQTAIGEALNLNLSGSVSVGGSLTYVLV